MRCSLEEEVRSIVAKDNGSSVHFEYDKDIVSNNSRQIENVRLTLITTNSSHGEMFVLDTTEYKGTHVECLEEVLDKLRNLDYRKKKGTHYLTYEIVWSRKGETEVHKSHFYGKDMLQIFNKFYGGKEGHEIEYMVRSATLLPMS